MHIRHTYALISSGNSSVSKSATHYPLRSAQQAGAHGPLARNTLPLMTIMIGISFTYALIVWLCKEGEGVVIRLLASSKDVTDLRTPFLLMTWVGPEKAPPRMSFLSASISSPVLPPSRRQSTDCCAPPPSPRPPCPYPVRPLPAISTSNLPVI